jgi:hypothetical protein
MATKPAEKGRELEAEKIVPQQTYAMDEETGELVPTQQAETKIPVATAQPQAPVVTQPQGQQVTVTPASKNKYLYDYNVTSLAEAYNKGEHTPRDIMLDRAKWGQENNNPLNWVEANYFQNVDLDKTKKDAEKEEKRKKWEDAFEHMGYGLISLGNFVGAALGGPAPSKTIEPMALTDRQRKLREATRAQRQAYNKDFFANYWKDRAEERQRERDQALIQYRNIQGQAAQQKADDNTRKTDATVAYYNAKTGQLEMITPAQLEKYQAEAEAARKRGNAAATNAAANMTRAQKAEDKSRGTVVTVTKDGRNKTTRESRPAGSPSKSTTTKKKVVY